MVGVVGQRGVVHFGHLGVVGQELDNLQRIFDMALYTQRERFEALQK